MRSWLTSWLPGRFDGNISRAALLSDLRYVVVDTELTSLDKRTNRLLSIGAVAMEGSRIRLSEQFYCVVNPGVKIPEETIVVHGLRPIDIEQGASPQEALREFGKFAQDSILVGHFAGIDRDVLRKEFSAIGTKFRNPMICTARAYRWLETHQAHLRGLDEHGANEDLYSIAKRYSLEMLQAHHALSDGFLTAQVWQRLMRELEAAGVRTFGELLRVAGV